MSLNSDLQAELDALKGAGTYKRLNYIEGPQGAHVRMEGRGDVIVLSSNNYLGLANEPCVVQAGIDALHRYGAGTASVRFICGTFTVHRELEAAIARFVGTAASMGYVSAWNANEALTPTIVREGDFVISDALNHASIIDSVRLAKAITKCTTAVYKHADMDDLREKLRATGEVWPVALVFILVITGIYGGWFSATEGAAIGAAATFLLAVTLGGMRWQGLRESLLSTTVTTGLIFVVLLGAELFSAALALSRLPAELSAVVAGFDVPPIVILLMILLVYFILGCFMESLAMVLLTLPIFIPLMLSLDFGLGREQVLVWFGILVLMSVEVGMISPPFGLNLFVINAMAKDVPMGETYRGVMGFVASDFVRIILLALLPAISLWLPGLW